MSLATLDQRASGQGHCCHSGCIKVSYDEAPSQDGLQPKANISGRLSASYRVGMYLLPCHLAERSPATATASVTALRLGESTLMRLRGQAPPQLAEGCAQE